MSQLPSLMRTGKDTLSTFGLQNIPLSIHIGYYMSVKFMKQAFGEHHNFIMNPSVNFW